LANGTLQRLDGLRKNGFGTWGVYGDKDDFEIRGVMMWKGHEQNEAWKDHPSVEYHTFTKLDPNNENDKNIIFDYWLQN
jgi:elongation factor 1-gamma